MIENTVLMKRSEGKITLTNYLIPETEKDTQILLNSCIKEGFGFTVLYPKKEQEYLIPATKETVKTKNPHIYVHNDKAMMIILETAVKAEYYLNHKDDKKEDEKNGS